MVTTDSGKRRNPYNFAPRFEDVVVFMACTNASFYGAAGRELEPAALASPVNTMLMQAAHAVAEDMGSGPGSASVVVQRLARWRHEGRVRHEQVLAASDALDVVELAGTPDVAAVLCELVPVLQRRIEQKALHEGITAQARGEGLQVFVDAAQKAASLGKVDRSLGVEIGSDAAFAEVERARLLDHLPLGVAELDTLLDGGPPRGTLTVVLAPQKSGKSMFLGHISASAMKRGQFVAYATLEVSRAEMTARVKANISGVPINTLLREGDTAEARAVFHDMRDALGPCRVQSFPARHTSVADLRRWVGDLERAHGRRLDLLVIDYLDKLRPPKSGPQRGPAAKLYDTMSEVYEEARVWAEQTGLWIITATQSKGRPGNGRNAKPGDNDVLDMGDEADSVEKSRIADLFITMNPRDDGKQVLFFVAGNRHGQQRVSAGPVPVDFKCGRISPVVAAPAQQGGDDAFDF